MEQLEAAFSSFWAVRRDDAFEARAALGAVVAPELLGHEVAKLALLLALVGAPVAAADVPGSRSEIHLLFVGGPGVGKSRLLSAAHHLAERSVFATGVRASRAGLTCGAGREGRGKAQL